MSSGELGKPPSCLVGKWIQEQESLKHRLVLEDDFAWTIASPTQEQGGGEEAAGEYTGEKLRYIGGVDLSFSKDNPSVACAALVVIDVLQSSQSGQGLTVVYNDFSVARLDIPYVPGFLAFREAPLLLKLLEKMKQDVNPFYPQVLMVDGNGLLHPRGFGLACHLGVMANLPTIGIGKNLHHVDGLSQSGVRHFLGQENCTEDLFTLIGNSGRIWGAAMQSTEGSVKPIFISTGHRVSLKTAITVVKLCCRYRIPEPIRQADIRSRAYLQKNNGI